ncbi:UNVERIFIED_CONTAM: hypothetical protein PYX00_011907 [Menopon gallinae]|uniref:Dihydrolipoamide acetyltransferase component of pyruvate dehydrogenase complex n=1 Tax=Menopon gallinae TaxID=328185 RepID=A0AAW2H8Z5_9NEOP
MTALSPTMEMGTIVEWKVKEGESVKEGDVLAEVETDKASMDLLSDTSGVVLKIFKDKGSEAKVGDIIAAIGKAGEDISAISKEVEATLSVTAPSEKPASTSSSEVKPVPAKTEEIKEVKREIDRKEILPDFAGPQASVKRSSTNTHSAVSYSSLNNELIPLTGKRKVIAQRLSESKNSAPHFYLMTSIEMDGLLEAREQLNKKRKDSKVSLNAFLMKIIAQVITRHQVINSSWTGEAIQNHDQVDIGLAVAQPDGLITPILRACEQKGILEIDQELNDLISRARANKLKSEEYTGATFTISSLGSMGIEQFTSIINPPGVAILAIGSIKKEVLVDEKDDLVIKKIMKVTLSCDHRVVDGAVGASFLKDLRDSLENPVMALY